MFDARFEAQHLTCRECARLLPGIRVIIDIVSEFEKEL